MSPFLVPCKTVFWKEERKLFAWKLKRTSKYRRNRTDALCCHCCATANNLELHASLFTHGDINQKRLIFQRPLPFWCSECCGRIKFTPALKVEHASNTETRMSSNLGPLLQYKRRFTSWTTMWCSNNGPRESFRWSTSTRTVGESDLNGEHAVCAI